MNTIKSLLTKSSKYQTIEKENTNSGLFQNGALGGFNSHSIVDIVVINKNITEVTFKATVRTHGDLAGEPIRLRLENETDIVETFLREELDEFYEGCARLQELIRKVKIKKAITKFLLKTWKEFPLAPMGVLAPGSAHARPSALPPIDNSGNFTAHVSA